MPPKARDIRMETAKWAQVQLLKMDWCSRHYMANRIKSSRPLIYPMIASLMAPDELLDGTATGLVIHAQTVIIMKDVKRQTFRQMSLYHYFKPARSKKRAVRPDGRRQVTLHRYFKMVK